MVNDQDLVGYNKEGKIFYPVPSLRPMLESYAFNN
jgi:hypothetical protein